MKKLKKGLWYKAIVTEWDKTTSVVSIRCNNDDATMRYLETNIGTNDCGDVIIVEEVTALEHIVAIEYLESLEVKVAGYETVYPGRRARISNS